MAVVGAVRLELRLASHTEWIKAFDPRDWTVTVPATAGAAGVGAVVRLDLDVDGWLVSLRGTVVSHRDDPPAAVVAVANDERDKINYINGFVRGGLLNLREKRRLPLRLAVTYDAFEGPAHTFTKDINEQGLFLLTEQPLPEMSLVRMLISLPGEAQPLSIAGKVSHTILEGDEQPAGMGIVFDLDDAARAQLHTVITDLEARLNDGRLPPDTQD